MRPRLLLPLFLLPLLPAACVQPPHALGAADIAAAEIHAKVAWLADDAREGRRTGTQGADDSARWLQRQLLGMGLQDAASFQEFPVQMAAEEGACQFDGVAGIGAVHTVAASASTSVTAPLVSAGYGMVMESHGMNEFSDGGVAGKVALVRRYTEMGPHADPAMAALGNLRAKVKAAAAAGAVGVILGTHPDDLARGGEAEIPFDAVPGNLPIPILTVSPADFAALEAAANAAVTPTVTLAAEVLHPQRIAKNVLGYLPGRSDRVIVIGAHYDHLGWGGEGSLAPGVHAIHNGADDNASGTAMVLELAEYFSSLPPASLEHSLLFALWSGEEEGLLGSAYWVAHPTVPLERVDANLNLDMVGRLASGRITVGSAGSCAAFGPALEDTQAWMEAQGLPLSFDIIANEMPGGGGSDHMSFHKMERPAIFFFSGLHADYHKPTDDVDKLSFPNMAVLGDSLVHFLEQLDGAPASDFNFVKPQADPHGGGEREIAAARVWFGSIPDYGAAPEGGGMQIAGTSPGSPAEKAGLKNGDIILQVGEVVVGDIYDFMDALGKYENGQTVDVRIRRDGEEQTLPLTFFPRAATGD